jgi:hypothetical protein
MTKNGRLENSLGVLRDLDFIAMPSSFLREHRREGFRSEFNSYTGAVGAEIARLFIYGGCFATIYFTLSTNHMPILVL